MTVLSEPDEGKLHVRFDEGAVGWNLPEDGTVPWTNAGVHCSTLLTDGAELNGYVLEDYVWPHDHFEGEGGSPGIGASDLPLDNAMFVLDTSGYVKLPIIPQTDGINPYSIQFTASACCDYNLAPTSIIEAKLYDKNEILLTSFSKTISLTYRLLEQNYYPYQGFDTNSNDHADIFYYDVNIYLGFTDEETILKISNIGVFDKIAIYGPIKILHQGLNPSSVDTDSDTINDNIELQKNPMTSPIRIDTDHDYLMDPFDDVPVEYDLDGDDLGWPLEIHYGTDPLNSDSDYDYLPDGAEIHIGTKPLDADSDLDTIPDGVEMGFGGVEQRTSLILNKNDLCHFLASMVPLDKDNKKICGIPLVTVPEGQENKRMEWAQPFISSYIYTSDPLDPNKDHDGLDDLQELKQGTDPNNPDTDNDWLMDGREESAIVDNSGPEISLSFMKPAGSNWVTISIVVWSSKKIDSIELWKSPYGDETLLDYRYSQNLRRVVMEYKYPLSTEEMLRGPTFDIYTTDMRGFERLESFKYTGGAFDQLESYISQSVALTKGPAYGGGVAGALTAWDDLLAGTMGFIEKIGSGKNLDAIKKLAGTFKEHGLGAFKDMADGIAYVQEDQNPFTDGSGDNAYPRCLACGGLTEDEAHDQFANTWYAGYIIATIGTFIVTIDTGGSTVFGATGATVSSAKAVEGFEAAASKVIAAENVVTQTASWSARVTAFAGSNMARIITLAIIGGTYAALKIIWPDVFQNWFSAGLGAVMIVGFAVNIKDIGQTAKMFYNILRLVAKSPRTIASMTKIFRLFKDFNWDDEQKVLYLEKLDTISDLKFERSTDLAEVSNAMIKERNTKNFNPLLDLEQFTGDLSGSKQYKLVKVIRHNKEKLPGLQINNNKFDDLASIEYGFYDSNTNQGNGLFYFKGKHIDGTIIKRNPTTQVPRFNSFWPCGKTLNDYPMIIDSQGNSVPFVTQNRMSEQEVIGLIAEGVRKGDINPDDNTILSYHPDSSRYGISEIVIELDENGRVMSAYPTKGTSVDAWMPNPVGNKPAGFYPTVPSTP